MTKQINLPFEFDISFFISSFLFPNHQKSENYTLSSLVWGQVGGNHKSLRLCVVWIRVGGGGPFKIPKVFV